MFGFFKKSEEEKLAERGDKSAILKLIETGKKRQSYRNLRKIQRGP